MANLQLPLNQDHEVLGSEYCSGYMDAVGKWNNGFYCPASDESQDVFCCGTDSHKYCCTKKDQVVQAEVEDLTVAIGILLGASAAILIITLVSCFCCSCCLLYKKRNPNHASLYHLHTTSEHSGVTNMYSLSASRSNTPLPMTGIHTTAGGVIPPGGGILVGGPNHHASQFHLQSSQLLIDDLMEPHHHVVPMMQQQANGGLSHSHTLPHNLSYQSKGVYRGDPDLISHHAQQVLREYGTLGRRGDPCASLPPPYHEPAPNPENLLLPSIVTSTTNNYLTTTSSNAALDQATSFHSNDSVMVSSISQCISGTTPNQSSSSQAADAPLFFAAQRQPPEEDDDAQLFHSTKF